MNVLREHPFAALGALSCAIAALVDRSVPRPYLDEVFHVPQAQRYCLSDYSWDPKITTPPGLYIISKLVLSQTVGCSTLYLRTVNLLGILVALPLVLRLFPDSAVSPTISSSSSSSSSSRSLSLNTTNRSLCPRTIVMLQLFPTLYFFGFLYYTDVWSTIFALLSVALASSTSTTTSTRAILARTAVGLASLFFRQTNIIWVFYAFLTEIFSLLVFPDEKGKERANDRLAAAPNQTVYAIASVYDVVEVCLSVVRRAFRKLRQSRVRRVKFCKLVVAYGVVGAAFVAFVVLNGGITLGDKDNHVAGLHIPQLFYLSAFICILALPTTFPQLSRSLTALIIYHPFAFLVASALFALAIKHTTIAHPFLIADNRHYPFYVWQRIINRTWWSRYALAPGYTVSMYIVFVRSWRYERFLSALLFAGACAAVLVPSPLIECRYYIVPYIIWRLRVAATPTAAAAVTTQLSDTSSVNVEDEVRRAEERERERVVAENFEICWYLLINAVTIGVFLMKPFEWPQEPGVEQRFMW